MAPLGWARCTDSVADVLRRGAWYPIVEDPGDGQVVLGVRDQRVRFSRVDLRVRPDPPDHWSVVTRTGFLRPTLGGKGREVTTTYAVCPQCQERQEFTDKPAVLVCTRCGASAPVDWTTPC